MTEITCLRCKSCNKQFFIEKGYSLRSIACPYCGKNDVKPDNSRTDPIKEEIIFETAKEGIKTLVDVMSTSLSTEGRRSKIARLIEELQGTLENTK